MLQVFINSVEILSMTQGESVFKSVTLFVNFYF